MRSQVCWMIAAVWVCAGLRDAGASAKPEASRFRYAVPLRLPASLSQDALAEWVLPSAAYAVIQNNLADIRVVQTKDGMASPFLVEPVTEEREERVRQPVGLRLVRAEERDGGLRVTLERQEPAGQGRLPLCGVAIRTPLRDFERRVRVEASFDGQAWRVVTEAGRLLDLSSYTDFRITEIALPALTESYLQLTVEQPDDVRPSDEARVTTSTDAEGRVRSVERQIREERRPFRIDRVEGWVERIVQVPNARPLVAREVREAGGPPAELRQRFPNARLLCFEAGRVPLERVRFHSERRFLNLSCQVFERADASAPGTPAWRLLTSGRLMKIVFGGCREEQMELVFGESRASRYCLVASDSAGAEDVTVAGGSGPEYRVVFPAEAGQAYTVLAGDPQAEGPPGEQVGQVRMLEARGFRPVRAVADGWPENPAWHPARSERTLGAWVFPAAVTLAVVALAGAVALALKRMPAIGE